MSHHPLSTSEVFVKPISPQPDTKWTEAEGSKSTEPARHPTQEIKSSFHELAKFDKDSCQAVFGALTAISCLNEKPDQGPSHTLYLYANYSDK